MPRESGQNNASSGIVLKGHHANQSKVGKEELYDKDGTLILRGHTTEGRLQGDCTYFYPDGKPMLQGKFSGSTLLEGNGFDPDGTEVKLTTPAEVSRFLTERLFLSFGSENWVPAPPAFEREQGEAQKLAPMLALTDDSACHQTALDVTKAVPTKETLERAENPRNTGQERKKPAK